MLVRRIPIWLLFAFLPAVTFAQGHRGTSEPPLNPAILELQSIQPADSILAYTGFSVSYNSDQLIPKWVAYELTAEELDGNVSRARSFSMDLGYKGRQAMREDYSNTGWEIFGRLLAKLAVFASSLLDHLQATRSMVGDSPVGAGE